MKRSLSWGIISTGRIAGYFAEDLTKSMSGKLAAVASRDMAKAQIFAGRHGIPNAHGSYEALLADPSVEAVYIATPHPQHATWIARAAEAGKHVLCEKPLAMNAHEARQAVSACRRNRVLLMEAFMYRCHPQIPRIVELVRSGALGKVGLIQASFSFQRPFNATQRLWNRELGGGAILDIGCYAVSAARLIAGAVAGCSFLDPEQVGGTAILHPETGVDLASIGTLGFSNGVIAEVACSIGLDFGTFVRIHGSEGSLVVPTPFVANRAGGEAQLLLSKPGVTEPEVFRINAGPLYAAEADAFARALHAGSEDVPEMTVADSLGNIATLDRWRAAVGLAYPQDLYK